MVARRLEPFLIPTGTGLAVNANEYIDFNELPPAKGKGKSVTVEGQVIVVQVADLMQSRKTIQDLASWAQCFGLYTAVVAKKNPSFGRTFCPSMVGFARTQ